MDGQRSPMGSTTLGGPRDQACSRSRPNPAFQGFERRIGRGRVHISSTFATTSPPASRISSATTPASSSWNRPASTVSFEAGWPGTPKGAMSTSGAPPRRTCGNRSRRADAARLSVNLAAKTRMSELAPQPRIRTIIVAEDPFRAGCPAQSTACRRVLIAIGNGRPIQRLVRYSTGTGSIESASSKPKTCA